MDNIIPFTGTHIGNQESPIETLKKIVILRDEKNYKAIVDIAPAKNLLDQIENEDNIDSEDFLRTKLCISYCRAHALDQILKSDLAREELDIPELERIAKQYRWANKGLFRICDSSIELAKEITKPKANPRVEELLNQNRIEHSKVFTTSPEQARRPRGNKSVRHNHLSLV